MANNDLSTQSVVFDSETREQLAIMAREDDRTNSALIRWLIRKEFAARGLSLPEPTIPEPKRS